MAEQVMRMPEPRSPIVSGGLGAESCPTCQSGRESHVQLQAKPAQVGGSNLAVPPIVRDVVASPGQPLVPTMGKFMESRFGHDFSQVRVHTDARSAESARALGARAYTVGSRIVFGAGQHAPATSEGRRLMAHELTHVVQQGGASRDRSRQTPAPTIQRQVANPAPAAPPLTGPLTDQEWQRLELWQSQGQVGNDPLTDDAGNNALVVASAIFCSRLLASPGFTGADPLLCVVPEVTRADPRVRQLVKQVTARGPIINWARVGASQRMLHVMELLVDTYHFPVNGAAGLVGNLRSESGVLPNRIQGSRPATPLRAPNFAGRSTDFTAEQAMNRNEAARQGPRSEGIGLAQWTSAGRRAGLFQHIFQGRQQGAAVLFNMDAQVDFLVVELQARYPHVYGVLTGAGVSLNAASDEVVYRYESPRLVLDEDLNLLPRNDPAVQAVFAMRRANSQRALRVYREAHPED